MCFFSAKIELVMSLKVCEKYHWQLIGPKKGDWCSRERITREGKVLLEGLDRQSEHFFSSSPTFEQPPTIGPTPKWTKHSAYFLNDNDSKYLVDICNKHNNFAVNYVEIFSRWNLIAPQSFVVPIKPEHCLSHFLVLIIIGRRAILK